jgi:iron complex transport system permease protein
MISLGAVTMRNRFPLIIGTAFIFTLFSIFFSTTLGSVELSLSQVVESLFSCGVGSTTCSVEPLYQRIVWEIRLPRILMAFLTGAGLSITGAILQSVTRNPLADPYLFGISSGASLGAVLAISTISGAVVSITVGALLGGFFSVFLMLALAGNAAMKVERLLLSGVAVSFMLGAFTSLVVYYSDPETATTLLFWMMGSFSNSSWSQLPLPLISIVVGLLLFIIYRHWINAIQAGDEGAFTLGIPVSKLRLFMLIICSMITAVLVAQVGGIGFVGLMVPHICRFIVGSPLYKVLPMCIAVGGSFMIWVDVIAHSILEQQVLPVGIVTSAIGSFFFFVILKTRSRSA